MHKDLIGELAHRALAFAFSLLVADLVDLRRMAVYLLNSVNEFSQLHNKGKVKTFMRVLRHRKAILFTVSF